MSLQLADDVGQLFGHRIGVGLEPGEGALIVARHALGQVGIGQRGQHLAGLADAAIDGLDQVVDAAGQRIELGIGELGFDALGEVAGNGGIDHLAEGALQVLHHRGAFGLAARCGALPPRSSAPP